MASLSIGIAMLLLTMFRTSCADAVPRDKKCKGDDPRQIYPYCMFDRRNMTLWCDQSNYTEFPNTSVINSHLYGPDCTTAKALYVNDSCLLEINEEDLRPYTAIRSFLGGQNFITKVKQSTFRQNRRLEEIDLCDNEIRTMENGSLKGLRRLKKLHLNRNHILTIDHHVLGDVHKLEELSLEQNLLSTIRKQTFRHQHNLRKLNLRGNQITSIEDWAFEKNLNMRHLHLDDNKIEIITRSTFGGLRQLEILTISHNCIKSWSAESGALLASVHTLHLGSNLLSDIRSLHLANMTSLQILSLDNNSLSEIPEDIFSSTPRITYLNFSKNLFKDIPENALKPLCHLESLILTKNQLKTPKEGWFSHLMNHAVSFTHTALSENLWSCDCDALRYQEFREVLKHSEDKNRRAMARRLEITCDSPRFAKGRVLDKELVSEIRFRLNCQPKTLDLRDHLGLTSTSHLCNSSGNSFNREHFDVTLQYIPRERPHVIQPSARLIKIAQPQTAEPVETNGSAAYVIIAIIVIGSILVFSAIMVHLLKRKHRHPKKFVAL